MKQKNIIFLSIGVTYLIISFILLECHYNISSKFYFIISLSSLIISVNEIFKSIIKSVISRNDIYNYYIKKYSLKDEKNYINGELNKVDIFCKKYNKLLLFLDFITYIFVFLLIIIIPFMSISEYFMTSFSNFFSTIGFALLFISIYINESLYLEESNLESNIQDKIKKYKKNK